MLAHARLRPPAAAGGLVVLGACRSTVAVSAYDESLTIGNAFVAAGAAGVIASLWPVPDRRTSLFMYVLHERLYRGDPADLALRGTQQWMLDPERLLPDGLPAALADVARSADLSDAAVWAAFTCQG
jgi:CHAT domain-containing protein